MMVITLEQTNSISHQKAGARVEQYNNVCVCVGLSFRLFVCRRLDTKKAVNFFANCARLLFFCFYLLTLLN